MTYTKDIFDYKKLSKQVQAKLRIDVEQIDQFREKIFNLFSMAKSENITKLNDNQIAVAYYRTYTVKNDKDIKTLPQIQAKLRSIISKDKAYLNEHPESKIKTLRRVANEKDWYTVE